MLAVLYIVRESNPLYKFYVHREYIWKYQNSVKKVADESATMREQFHIWGDEIDLSEQGGGVGQAWGGEVPKCDILCIYFLLISKGPDLGSRGKAWRRVFRYLKLG
jgi:hypothetical protein